MTDARDAQRERDESFQSEALPWLDDVYRFALSLTRDASDALNDVTDWNDAARRTVRQVLDAFQRAADAP